MLCLAKDLDQSLHSHGLKTKLDENNIIINSSIRSFILEKVTKVCKIVKTNISISFPRTFSKYSFCSRKRKWNISFNDFTYFLIFFNQLYFGLFKSLSYMVFTTEAI